MTGKLKIIIILTVFLLAFFMQSKAESTPASGDEEKNIEDITKKVYPSVVKVEARNRIRKVATGVVIDKNGHIVTTALIFPRDEKISVITHKGERLDAKFLGMDSETHLALIKVEDKKLTPMTMGKSKDLSAGAWIGVVSISPENTPAVTQGIVNSVSPERIRLNIWVVRGSSGSPVVDKKGRMVGLLRGIYYDNRPVILEVQERTMVATGVVLSKAEAPSSGMAEAIAVDVVKDITSEIREKGKVERGWLGVYIDKNEDGDVEIVDVDKESPAELAKLKIGDIVLEIEGKEVKSTEMLAYEIRKRKPGENITLKIERDGRTMDVKVQLGEHTEKDVLEELIYKFPRLFPPPEPPKPPKPLEPPKPPKPAKPGVLRWGWESRKYIGVYLNELNRELSEHFGVKEGRGLMVSRFGEDSPAEKAGLKVGDVIVTAEGVRVERWSDLSELIQDKEKGDKIKIEFLRDKKKRSVEIEIEEEEGGRAFFFSDDWGSYVDSWDKYRETLKEQYEKWQDRYSQDYEIQMKRLNKELEKIAKKSKEATEKLKLSLRKKRAVKV